MYACNRETGGGFPGGVHNSDHRPHFRQDPPSNAPRFANGFWETRPRRSLSPGLCGIVCTEKQVQRIRKDGERVGRLVFSEPKNASRRTIDLPQRALEALMSHRKHQLVEKIRASSYEDSDLVFATRKGTPLDAQNIVNRHFKPLLKRAGLPSIRWYDLRHTCATLLLGRGVHPTLVQHLLGHASITMTLDRYSHWLPSMGRHAAEGMDQALGQ